jgi:hypothetical protein
MRKFSDLIKEQEGSKEYKYTANVVVEGKVVAASEGEAGGLVDKEMDAIPGMINYEINNIIDATTQIGENKIVENAQTKLDKHIAINEDGIYGNNIKFVEKEGQKFLNANDLKSYLLGPRSNENLEDFKHFLISITNIIR